MIKEIRFDLNPGKKEPTIVFGECFTMHGNRIVSFEWTVRLRDGDKINELSSLVLYSSLIVKHHFGFVN